MQIIPPCLSELFFYLTQCLQLFFYRTEPIPADGSEPAAASSSAGSRDKTSTLPKKTESVNEKDSLLHLDQVLRLISFGCLEARSKSPVVTRELRNAGLVSSNLMFAIDFTKSNKWLGKVSFNNRSLHAFGNGPNPYEKAISIIGKTLAPFDNDNLIPCFGFGDATTEDRKVFNFHKNGSPCHGFEEVLACYRKIAPTVQLSGPTSYAPVINAAIDIVESSVGQFHVLVIISDGQVNKGINGLSQQEKETINSIVEASSYPLSIVVVGVGDGPWEDMKKFINKIPARDFNNFKFVNFHQQKYDSIREETAFARAALMEIPIQYEAANSFGLLGRKVTRGAKEIVLRPPLAMKASQGQALQDHRLSKLSSQALDVQTQVTTSPGNNYLAVHGNSMVYLIVINGDPGSTVNVIFKGPGAGAINHGENAGGINVKHMVGNVEFGGAKRGDWSLVDGKTVLASLSPAMVGDRGHIVGHIINTAW